MSCTKKDEEIAELRIEAYPRMEQRIGNPVRVALCPITDKDCSPNY